MKSYLNDFNIHPSRDIERAKNKSQKSTLRNKHQIRSAFETLPSSSLPNKSKPKVTKRNKTPVIEAKPRPSHQRNYSQLESFVEERPASGFGKTLSKKRLKTDIGNYHAETVHIIKKEKSTVKIEDNFITGLVKARLTNERKKRTEGEEVRRISELTDAVRGKYPKNPQEGDEQSNTRRSLTQSFELIQLQLRQLGQSVREEALCELVHALLGRLRHLQQGQDGQRLVRVVRQLQERNVRLMRLVNYMKGRGVDVDLYWNESALS